MTNAKDLLRRIAADVQAGRVKPAELARRADISLTSLISMLDPAWENRAVANLEALERAYLAKPKRDKDRRVSARQ